MLESAVRICDAKFGSLHRYDGDKFYPAATLNSPPALVEFQRQRGAFLPETGNPLDRMLQTKTVVHVVDDTAEQVRSPAGSLGGARSLIAVPMLKENELAGAIFIYRQEVRPFTDRQIDLVKNFAAQAVIAIENTRLLNELRQRTDDLTEALEQQTATSDVLGVISSSPGELQPVFTAMLANAMRICGAKFARWHDRRGDCEAQPGVQRRARRRRRQGGTETGRIGAQSHVAAGIRRFHARGYVEMAGDHRRGRDARGRIAAH